MSKIHNQKNGSLNESDRLLLGQLLMKAGYTVRIDKAKESEKTNAKNIIFVEYFGDGEFPTR